MGVSTLKKWGGGGGGGGHGPSGPPGSDAYGSNYVPPMVGNYFLEAR